MWTKELFVVSLPAHALMLVLALVISFLLRKKNEKIKRIPIYVLAIIFLVMEVGKQVEALQSGDYSLWNLPLHFCSFFIFWPIFSMLGKGKVREFGDTVSFVFAMMIMILMLVDPYSIYGTAVEDFYHNGTWSHTLVFHELVWLYGFLFIFLGLVKKIKVKNWYFLPIALAIYAVIVVPCAYLLNENYCCILQFTGFAILENIRIATGQVFYNCLEFVLGLAGMFAIFFACCGFVHIHNKRQKKLEKF